MLEKIKSLFVKEPKPLYQRIPIAGLKYYRAEDISNLMHRGDELDLRLEPDNPHDPNAVMIFWRQNKIGYIPSDAAKEITALLSQYRRICAKIVEIDPETDPHRWVKLDIYPNHTPD